MRLPNGIPIAMDWHVKYRMGIAVVLLVAPALQAYSPLTHEAIIDTLWDQRIKPVLLARFPESTPDDLRKAHAFAYGGSIIQDMGYYPHGDKFFTDLVHYVHSGDFVTNLIAESRDLNEYAFALGALAHYAADNDGHALAVNLAVPIEYPKLRRKFGKVVTYADDKTSHLKVEFGFDVLQVARGSYAPQAYHDFIGFDVAPECLDRALRDTYSLGVTDFFPDPGLTFGTYRHTVSTIIPLATRVAWSMRKKDLVKDQPSLTRQKFVYNLSRASYRKEWDRKYEQPGIGARFLAFLMRIVPKVGPLKTLDFKIPTPATERLFEGSFDKTVDLYRSLLNDEERRHTALENRDFDTGKPTAPGEYRLADNTYAEFARRLAGRDPARVDPKVRQYVLGFFSNLNRPFATKQNPEDWSKTLVAVERLKTE